MAQFYQAGCFLSGSGFDRDHAKAVELYRSLADRRIPRAQVALGRCYENGEGVDQDFDSAIEWYSKAANQGSEDGRLHIVFLQAWFSFIGRGVEPSDIDAFNRWQEVSIQSTDPIIKPIATHMVGWMHYLGRGTQRSQEEGAKLIRESKSKDFPLEEDNSLAGFNHGSSHSPASRKFHQLCELGSERDWLCKHLMAVCLMNGLGTAEDAKKAAGMFEQLAIDGHSDSQVWIGRCCFYGRGISEDNDRALEWFSESARQGNSYGQWKSGIAGRPSKEIDTDRAVSA
ncbi:uncharacterized protein BJ171DRAFT_569710 [Polychytrium aggregatum]|uniref:uncharacterized protein n=1 Tax=Polychytrium aggregatum TaxID=110093 RepID=UPI0022FF0FA6|nr:uncharacterized protein BJ171DRAFT_569710 [Polychytrium aggregatum]KAI9202285.1 hypothetical protein BJ171DRAFT_569710 [Polychytrium aggregatum]